ncbi:MAG: hypothetical protein K2G20_03810, partial [Lachnospiraceae bacterium]|nr:hypothetical protein [Lachnospiraceae bacterium]
SRTVHVPQGCLAEPAGEYRVEVSTKSRICGFLYNQNRLYRSFLWKAVESEHRRKELHGLQTMSQRM